jgi:hypothetical protein
LIEWNEKIGSRVLAGRGALAAALVAAAALAPSARATSGTGEATISPASHDSGRTLSGQGVRILAGTGATAQGGKLSLPIAELDPASQPSARSSGTLRFKRGKRSVPLSGVRFDLTAGTLVGRLGNDELPVFKLGAAPSVDRTAGTIGLSEGRLRLTPEAASALEGKLGLRRALAHKGVGMVWLSARALPTLGTAQKVVSGSVQWGVLASWRKYVLGNFGPGSVGTIATADGATSTGTLSEANAYFSLPVVSGSFQKGLYGAADKLVLSTAGSVVFTKPGHCIVEVEFSGVDVTIGGSASVALDSVYDIDTPAGMSCTDEPTVSTGDVQFAKLDVGALKPAFSADGKAVTWTAVPATLTAAGGAAWGAGYADGQVLDPVTISVGLG